MPTLTRTKIVVTASTISTNPVILQGKSVAGLCFTTASSTRHNGFMAGAGRFSATNSEYPRVGLLRLMWPVLTPADDRFHETSVMELMI